MRKLGSGKIWLLILVFSIVFGGHGLAQKIFFEQLTAAEGLPSDYVNTVFQDSKGDLWIGTDKGACRYNGKQFSYFTKDNGLTSNFIFCITEDPTGNIWFGTFEGGACKYDGQKFTPLALQDKNEFKNIFGIVFNSDGSFFLESGNFHQYFFQNEKAAPQKFSLDAPVLISPMGNGRFLASSAGNAVYLLTRAGTHLSFQQIWHSASKTEFLLGPPHHDQFVVQKKHELSIHEVRDNGDTRIRKIMLPAPLKDGYEKFFYSRGKEIWIGSYQGLLYIGENNQPRLFAVEKGLVGNYVNNICEDRQKNIYICIFGGGIRIWPSLYLQEFGVNGKVNSISPAPHATYISTTRGVYKYSSEKGMEAFQNLRFDNFSSIYQTEKGEICLGTYTSFLRMPGERALRHLDNATRKSHESLTQVGISGFRWKKDGRLFVSMYGEGVYAYDPNNRVVDSFTAKNGRLGSGMVEFLKPAGNSLAALTYSAGLTLIDSTGHTVIIEKRDGLLSNTVYSVFREKGNETWIGTLGGLNLYDGKKIIKTFSSKEGFIGNKALCIFRDARQRLWVLSDRYLHLLEKDGLRAIRSHPVLFDNKNSINRAEYDTVTGMLYLGLNDAFLVVDISKIAPDTMVRTPALAAVRSGDARMVFQFAARYYSITERSDIYYMLTGYDEEWKMLDYTAEQTYQQLPAGNFELVARAINPDGYASRQVSLYRFRILPAIWKRWWFVLLAAAALLILVFYASNKYSKKRYEGRLRKMEEMYKLQLERERIARELHDHVGSQLTFLINKIEDEESLFVDKAEADKLSNFARGAMRDLRETIWALDKKEVLPEELENKIRQLVRLYKDKKYPIELDWQYEQLAGRSLKSLEALNIYRIIQEAINNAIKYSDALLIVVKVALTSGGLYVSVIDDGKGFDPGATEKGYGLKNMRKRAEEMNAELAVESRPGKGTIVKITQNQPFSR